MRRIFQILTVVVVSNALLAGVAMGAAKPTTHTGTASSVTQTSADLHGTVNPNGSSTTYYFEWGTTTSYGSKSSVKSAGNGNKVVTVDWTAGDLTPGSTYHFRLVATNSSGTTNGADHTFTTGASVTTGPVTDLSSSGAMLNGTINPNDKKTTWYFQWGTTSLSQQTKSQTLSPSSSPKSVSWSLQGLLHAETVYEYRVVAVHPNGVKTFGNTVDFMTYPTVRPYAVVTAKTRPRHRVLYPYVFTTTGTISGGSAIPAQFACIGEVTLRFYVGTSSRQVRFETAPVQSNCTYSARTVFYHLPAGTHVPVRLRVVVHFVATPYLARTRAPIRYVTID